MAAVNSVVPKETLSLIRSIADREKVYTADKLVPLVQQEIESRWSKNQRAIYTGELRLSTETQVKEAVYVFCQSINWENELNGLNDMPVVSENGIRFIHSIATKIGSTDKSALFAAVCDAVAEDEENNNRARLNTRMVKMGLETTNDIRFAIDLYHSYLEFGLMGGERSRVHQREYQEELRRKRERKEEE